MFRCFLGQKELPIVEFCSKRSFLFVNMQFSKNEHNAANLIAFGCRLQLNLVINNHFGGN